MNGWRGRILSTLALLCLLGAAAAPAGAATKLLYPYDNNTLTRTPQPAVNTAGVVIASKGGTKDSTLTPALAKNLVLTAGTITATVVSTSASSATLTVSLWDNGTTQIGTTSAAQASTTTPTARNYTMTLASNYTLLSGHTLVMRVTNTTSGANKDATVYQYNTARGQLSFATSTFVNIDSLAVYSATYPSVSTLATYAPLNSVFIRATVSDPFGAADVSAAQLTLTNPSSVIKVGPAQAITEVVAARTASSKTFEYEYPLPSNAAAGTWNVSVTALEGTEGTVTHTLGTTFAVAIPALTIVKSHTGNFTAGTNNSYSLVVHNGGGTTVSGTTTVTDVLPTGLSFLASAGCSAVGQTVTCTSTASVTAGNDFPTMTVNVAVAGSAGSSVNNVASVSNPGVNGGASVNSNTDSTTILHPDLSTSTKFVADQNGGDSNPGDTLRYTITLNESVGAAGSGISVTDDIPAGVTGFSVVSIPVGATNSSVIGGGANGTGYLNITGSA
jgi:uncharacterized repeat protein (TIGR01451 family)